MGSSAQLPYPDVLVRHEGTVWIFNPLSSVAQVWFAENVHSDPWQCMGTSLVVEHRFAVDLIEGITDAGLDIG
jgi:hypothetical protein